MPKIFLVKFEEDGTTEDYRYELRNLKRVSYDMNTPVSPMPLPEEGADENILIKMEGNSSAIELSWVIRDEATDTAPLNTVVGSTRTIRDQVFFFEDKFIPERVEDSFAILFDYDGTGVLETDANLTYFGTFTQFHVDMADPSLLTFNAKCKFIQGTVALLFEVDVSSEPLDHAVVDSVGSFDSSWTVPIDAGSGTIDDYRIYYRIRGSSGNFLETDVGGITTSKINITATTGFVYEVYVRAHTEIGYGRPSRTKVVTVT